MNLLSYLLRRLVGFAAVMIGISMITFGISHLVPADPAIVVPGHGEVLHGKGYIERVAVLLRNLRQQVNELVERNGGGFPLEEVQKAIDLSEARRAFAGDDADNREFFDASMASLIRTLHAELRAR